MTESQHDNVARLELIRNQAIKLAGRKSARNSVWTNERPTKWQPNYVIDPRIGQPFTSVGAWEFLVDCLVDGDELHEVTLEHPPGKIAYCLIRPTPHGDIYIKFELGSGTILGRSFHYSRPRSSGSAVQTAK